jgi:hypothetical protein
LTREFFQKGQMSGRNMNTQKRPIQVKERAFGLVR